MISGNFPLKRLQNKHHFRTSLAKNIINFWTRAVIRWPHDTPHPSPGGPDPHMTWLASSRLSRKNTKLSYRRVRWWLVWRLVFDILSTRLLRFPVSRAGSYEGLTWSLCSGFSCLSDWWFMDNFVAQGYFLWIWMGTRVSCILVSASVLFSLFFSDSTRRYCEHVVNNIHNVCTMIFRTTNPPLDLSMRTRCVSSAGPNAS